MSKDNVANEAANIEEGSGGGRPPGVSADQVQLRDQGVHKLAGVICPAMATVNNVPAGVRVFRPLSSIALDTTNDNPHWTDTETILTCSTSVQLSTAYI